MKHTLIFFLLISSLNYAQQKDIENDKKIALDLCDKFSKQYSKNNSYKINRMVYIKTIQIKLMDYDSDREESILRKLHELCPSFLEYSTVASKIKAESKGQPDAFKLWDIYIKSKNDIPWTENEKKQFLDICNYALSKRENSEELCKCTIDKISEKLSAEYFLGLSTNEQGYLGGQIGYVYCSE
jgi:hypothetical protein